MAQQKNTTVAVPKPAEPVPAKEDISEDSKAIIDKVYADAEKQKTVAIAKQPKPKQVPTHIAIAPPAAPAEETARDGHFIAYNNGTVLDTKRNRMWAAKDNGNDINWANAKSYCKNYRGGGYNDWRLPTQIELLFLYDFKGTGKNDRLVKSHMRTDLRFLGNRFLKN